MSGSLASPIAIVGNLNVDQIVTTVRRWPEWDEELIVETSRLELAGTAGYLALAARGLGVSPVVVSTVGDDGNGEFLRRELAAAGIDDAGVETISGAATCLGMIFVGDRGQRAILSVLGAHESMTVETAERHDREIAACAEVFLCGNYLLPQFSPRAVAPYAQRLRERGQIVAFDPSWDPHGWGEETRAGTLALLEHVDIFFPNDVEVCHLTGVDRWQDAVAALSPAAPQVVIKRGAAGAVWVSGSDVIEHPGFPVEAKNTIGAGDIFDIGFMYGRRRGWDTQRCLAFACATAAFVVAQDGPRHYPGEDEVWYFVDRWQDQDRC